MKSNSSVFVVLLMFILFIIIFAGGAIGQTDLTPDTPPAAPNGDGNAQTLFGVQGGGSSACGSSYTVQSGDTLSRIAQLCGSTVKDLQAVNPDLTNPNLIHVGQKLNIVGALPTAVIPTALPPTAVSPAQASRALMPEAIPSGLRPGGSVDVTVKGFPSRSLVTVGIGKVDAKPEVVSTGRTDVFGAFKADVKIPLAAKPGESWTVTIESSTEPKMKVTSVPFVIEK